MDQSAPMSTTNILLLIVAGIEIAITYSLVFAYVFFIPSYRQWSSPLPTTTRSQYIHIVSQKQWQKMDQSALKSTADDLILTVPYIHIAIVYLSLFALFFFFIRSKPALTKRITQQLDDHKTLHADSKRAAEEAYTQALVTGMKEEKKEMQLLEKMLEEKKKARVGWKVDDGEKGGLEKGAKSEPAAEKAYTQALANDKEEERKEMQLLKKTLKEKRKARVGSKVDGGEKSGLEKGVERRPDVGHASEEEGFEWVEKCDA